jgi:hypothetical protein
MGWEEAKPICRSFNGPGLDGVEMLVEGTAAAAHEFGQHLVLIL